MQVPRDGLLGKLQKLSQSQQSIESVSSFCVFYHKDAKGVVALWEEEFFRAPTDRKMALLYLANHILQEGRRKGTAFQDEFYRVLPKAMQHLLAGGDDKVKRSVTRLVAIWEERRVFGTRHIKSFTGLVGSGGAPGGGGGGGGGPGGGAAAAAAVGGGGGGGYQPARKGSGGLGGAGGDAVAAAARLAAAAADKQKAFEASWRPELPLSGDLAAVTTASGQLEAYEAALQKELDARRAAVAALQATVRQQEEAIAGAAARLGAAGAQRQQLQARIGALSTGLMAGLQGLAGLPGFGAPPAGPAPPPAAAAAAAAPPAAAGSPEAPEMEDDFPDPSGAANSPQYARAPPPGPPAPVAGTAQPPGGGLLADALSALPASERDRLGVDLQQLMSSGLLAGGPGGGNGAAAGYGGAGGEGAFADEGDDPYDPEDPF